jgi:hypothetical protein
MDLTKIEDVASLKSSFHATFDTPQGKDVMLFLEKTCCWYQSVWTPGNPDMTLINDGKRQVLATIKTILTYSPEQIHQLTLEKEA